VLLCFHPAALLPVQFIWTGAFIQSDVSSTVSLEEEQLVSGYMGPERWHHPQPIISLVGHTGCISWGPLAFWMYVTLTCAVIGSWACMQTSTREGDRLAGVKKLRSHHSLSLLLTFNGGRRRRGLGGGFNLEAFLKEDAPGTEGRHNQRPSNPTAS